MDWESDRSYQAYCIAHALRENVIVALPTGSGKTRIAVRVLQYQQTQLSQPGRVAVFLAPTVPLCIQQCWVLEEAGLRTALLVSGTLQERPFLADDLATDRLPARPNGLGKKAARRARFARRPQSAGQTEAPAVVNSSGSNDDPGVGGSGGPVVSAVVALATRVAAATATAEAAATHAAQPASKRLARAGHAARDRVAQVMERCDVIIGTPGELLVCLTHAWLHVAQICTLVLDEAHHSSPREPYGQLLNSFVNQAPLDTRPRILGLTATPLQVLEDAPPRAAPQPGPWPVGSQPCSVELLTSACVLGPPDRAAVERVVPIPATVVLHYPRPPPNPSSAMADLLQELRAAERALGNAHRLFTVRATFLQQERLMASVRRGGGAITAKRMTGLVVPQARSIYHHLGRQLRKVVECCEELGLWAGLQATRHALLGASDTALVRDWDLDMVMDSDDSEGEEGGDSNGGAAQGDGESLSTPRAGPDGGTSVLSPRLVGSPRAGTPAAAPQPPNGALASIEDGVASAEQQRALKERQHECRRLETELMTFLGKIAPPPKQARARGRRTARVPSKPLDHAACSELERQAARHAVENTVMALAAAVPVDPDDLTDIMMDMHALLEEHGLEGVLDGRLFDVVPRLTQHCPDVLTHVLGPPPYSKLRSDVAGDATSPDDAAPPGARPTEWFSPKLRQLLDVLLSPSGGAGLPDAGCNGTGNGHTDEHGSTIAFFYDKVETRKRLGNLLSTVRSCSQACAAVVHHLLRNLPAATAAGVASSMFLGNTGEGSLGRAPDTGPPGSQASARGDWAMGMSAQMQALVMDQFRSGALNLLLATHVGAEGLDFGSCNRVVLSDVPHDIVQLTQCKGRARRSSSTCVVLIPEGDLEAQRRLEGISRDVEKLQHRVAHKTLAFDLSRGRRDLPPPPSRPVRQPVEVAAAPRTARLDSDDAPPEPHMMISWDDADEDAEPEQQPHGTGSLHAQTLSATPCNEPAPTSGSGAHAMGGAGDGDAPAEEGVAPFAGILVEEPAFGPHPRGGALPASALLDVVVPSTGARCSAAFAQTLVEAYCESLPGNYAYARLKPQYVVLHHGEDAFSVRLLLPSNAGGVTSTHSSTRTLVTFESPPCQGVGTAKAAACLLAVRQLLRDGLLDRHLQPTSALALLAQGRWGTTATLAAQLMHNEIVGFMPRQRLPHKLADCLLAPASDTGPNHVSRHDSQGSAIPAAKAAPGGVPQSKGPGCIRRHLYGWVMHACDLPSHAVRGTMGADVYTLAGPWPAWPSPVPADTLHASPGSHTAHRAFTAAAAEGGDASPGLRRPFGFDRDVRVHPLLARASGQAWLQPYGLLLEARLPPAALPPFSVWLPGRRHVLVACVHLGEVQLTQPELAAAAVGHACLQAMVAESPAGPGVQPAGGKAGGRAPPPPPPATPKLRHGRGATRGASRADPAAGLAALLADGVAAWNAAHHVPELVAALAAAGKLPEHVGGKYPPPSPTSPTDTLSEQWWMVTPIASTSPGSPNPDHPLPIAGRIDWEVLARIARGATCVADLIPPHTPRPDSQPPEPPAAPAPLPPQPLHAVTNAALGDGHGALQSIAAAREGAVSEAVDAALFGRILTPVYAAVDDRKERFVYLGPAARAANNANVTIPTSSAVPGGSPGEGAQACGSDGAVSAQAPGLVPVRLDSPLPPSRALPGLRRLPRQAADDPGLPGDTHRARLHRQFPWVGAASLPADTLMVVGQRGTGTYLRPNLTQPPVQRKRAKLRFGSKETRKGHFKELQQRGLQPMVGLGPPEDDAPPDQAAPDGALPSASPDAASPAGDSIAPTKTQAAGGAAVAAPESAHRAASSTDRAAMSTDATGQAATPTTPEPAAPPPPPPLVLPDWAHKHGVELLPAPLLLVHPLDMAEWSALVALPSLMRRLQALTRTHEFRDVAMAAARPAAALPPVRDLLVCLTAASANESYSSEGAETLGDCVLDYLASVYLFHTLPEHHEGVLTECRVRLVANEVLLRLCSPAQGGAKGGGSPAPLPPLPIHPYLQTKAFDRGWEWRQGAMKSPEARGCEENRRGKLVADCVEAVIGAVFLYQGGAAALHMMGVNNRGGSAGPCTQPTCPTAPPAPDAPQPTAPLAADSCCSAKRVREDPSGQAGDVDEGGFGDAMAEDRRSEAPPATTRAVQHAKRQARALTAWDAAGLAAALLRSSAFLCDMAVLPPDSAAILAAFHSGCGGLDVATVGQAVSPEAMRRVEAAHERAGRSRARRTADAQLADRLAGLLGGYAFRRPELLREALTHISHPSPPSNQRFEFIGDAALDMVVTCHLVAACGQAAANLSTEQALALGASLMDPGLVTHRRSMLVSNKHLSLLCVRCGLHNHMRSGLPAVRRLVAEFAASVGDEAANAAREAVAAARAAARSRRKYGQSTGAPKLLADLVEAVLGAVLIDSGGDLAQVWRALWGMVQAASMTGVYAVHMHMPT